MVQELLLVDVGIGTTAPDKKLDVRGDGSTWPIAALSGSNSHGTGLQLYNSNTTVQDWAIIGGGSSHNYSFRVYDQTDATYRFAIDRDGKVGIGGTNAEIVAPTTQLDIKSTGTAKANLDMLSLTNKVNAADMDGTETSIKFNQWYYDATTPATEDSGRITVGTINDWTTSAGTRDSEMSFDISIDGALYQMGRFNPDGFIIDEYTRLQRNTSTNGLHLTDSGGNAVAFSTLSGSNGGFRLDNTTTNAIYRGSGVSFWDSTESYRLQGNTVSGYMQLDMNKISLVRDATSAASKIFQFGDGGTYDQFSIAEDSRGSTATNGLLLLRATKTGDYGYSKVALGAVSGSANSYLYVSSTSAAEAFRFDTNTKSHALDIARTGAVTIGDTLTVTGIATLADASVLASSAAPTADAQIANKKYVDDTHGSATIGGSITDNQIAVGATTANSIEGSANLTYDGTTFTASGFLVATGIETTTQAAGFLKSGIKDNLYFINSADTSDYGLISMDTDGLFKFQLQDDPADRFGFFVDNAAGTNVEAMTIGGGSGNVGIGTTSPVGKLEVIGSDGTVVVTPDGDARELVIRNNDRAGISIIHGEGIGDHSNIVFGSASDANGANIMWNYNAKTYTIGTQQAGSDMIFRTANGVEAMRIDDSQNVGIGTTAPAAKLHVDGDIRIDNGHTLDFDARGYIDVNVDVQLAKMNFSLEEEVVVMRLNLICQLLVLLN